MNRPTDRMSFLLIGLISVVAIGFLFWLMLRGTDPAGLDLSFVPAVNATLNATSATLMVCAFVAIKKGNRALHRRLMSLALVASTLFFVGYSAYHYAHGDTHFTGQGAIRSVYFAILISHIALSVAVVPMVLLTVYFAATKRFEKHKKIARWTFPIWLYVSVTGVVVFLMLHT